MCSGTRFCYWFHLCSTFCYKPYLSYHRIVDMKGLCHVYAIRIEMLQNNMIYCSKFITSIYVSVKHRHDFITQLFGFFFQAVKNCHTATSNVVVTNSIHLLYLYSRQNCWWDFLKLSFHHWKLMGVFSQGQLQ